MESIKRLRDLADDMNSYEIIDHVHTRHRFMIDGAWLDSWHEAFDKACGAIEAEIAEKYMELPLDADGIPIHVGDLIEYGCKGERLEVTHIGWTKHGDPTVAYRRPNGTIDSSCIGSECRHIKSHTLEDILQSAGVSVAVIEDVAAEIREMLGVE